MGFRFQKRLRIIPGVTLNLSKSGPSMTIGGKGLSMNFRGRKATTTVSLPGTGLSYRETTTTPEPPAAEAAVADILKALTLLAAAAVALYLFTR